MKASAERTALLQQAAKVKAAQMRRAVDNVMDGGIPVSEAYLNHGVDYDALRAALAEAGWKPPKRVRQNGSRSRAKQRPRARSDNQS